MLGISLTARVVWRRRHASRHYVGYAVVADNVVRLAGNEQDTAIHAVLSIPPAAIQGVRVGCLPEEEVVGEQAVVIELADDDPIYVRPLTAGALDLAGLARKLGSVSAPVRAAAR